MNTNILYPYLIPGLFNPDQAEMCPDIGHGVHVMLSEDHENEGGIVHAYVFPDKLRDSGLSVEEAHQIALENLEAFVSTGQMAMQMIGSPGEDIHFLLFSQHARAAACLRLPNLYDNARHFLQADEILACAPQRESLIIFPKRDRQYREGLVARIREIEADARKPITFELFEVTPEGIRPFVEQP